MAGRGILVGLVEGQRLYYLIDAAGDSEPDGALINPAGRTKLVNFSKTLSTARNVEKLGNSDFHDFLWGVHDGDKLQMWKAIFISRVREIPSELLQGVDIRSDFSPGKEKIKKINKTANNFRKANAKSTTKGKGIGYKSLGRRIGTFSANVSFDPNAFDADGDGFVQDSTPWMRPAIDLPNVGMRSTATLSRDSKTLEEFGDLINPEVLDEVFELVNTALTTGTTSRNRRVKIDEYDDFGEPEILRIVDTNKETGKQSEVVIGSDSLMAAEEHAHKVGMKIIEIAMRRVDIQKMNKDRRDRISELSQKFMKLAKTRAEVAKKLGLLYSETRYGKVVPNTRLKRDRPPSDKRLLALHSQLIKELDASDAKGRELDAIESQAPVKSPELEQQRKQWRELRDRIYEKYTVAVNDVFEKEADEAGGDAYRSMEQEAAKLLVDLRDQKSTSLILHEQIMDIFQELGVTFGTEELRLQIPKRNATEEDRAFSSAAKELANHAAQVAGKTIPDPLIRQINANSGSKGIKVKKVPSGSGHAGSWAKEVRRIETNGQDSVTAHELVHAAADANPFLNMVQLMILWRRQFSKTSSSRYARDGKISDMLKSGWEEPRSAVAAGDLTKIVEDHFMDPYAGRIYDGGSAAETMTRAFDYLLDPDFASMSDALDTDLIATTFGAILMASLVGDDFDWW